MTASAEEGLTVAVAKGRILDEAIPLLGDIGIRAREDPLRTRKLILEADVAPGWPPVRLVLLRAQDVPTYLEYGAADAGIAGRDVLLEYPGEEWYEPLDLGIARCRLVVAAREDDPRAQATAPGSVRVATKFERIARRHFAKSGVRAEIVKLYGSMELAPLVGLADRIVDLVATGNTLRANGLRAVEDIADVSARLIVNKASMKMKASVVKEFVAKLRERVEASR
ncbi:MAG: ATP phosphoribosyltransferase [Immundisolibacterales bacterium]|nr:ATP phosphoribosyltransferase [Immundisolibacterales bacterium]